MTASLLLAFGLCGFTLSAAAYLGCLLRYKEQDSFLSGARLVVLFATVVFLLVFVSQLSLVPSFCFGLSDNEADAVRCWSMKLRGF